MSDKDTNLRPIDRLLRDESSHPNLRPLDRLLGDEPWAAFGMDGPPKKPESLMQGWADWLVVAFVVLIFLWAVYSRIARAGDLPWQ